MSPSAPLLCWSCLAEGVLRPMRYDPKCAWWTCSVHEDAPVERERMPDAQARVNARRC